MTKASTPRKRPETGAGRNRGIVLRPYCATAKAPTTTFAALRNLGNRRADHR